MQLHPNAKLTPKNRLLLVRHVFKQKWPVAKATRAAAVSRQTAYKWLNRFRESGRNALEDRSCRPKSFPRQTSATSVRRMIQLRRRKKAGWEISQELGVPVSTVSKLLKREGVGRIWKVEEELAPPQRYERHRPGDLVHIDAKKLARIDGVGHRIHVDRRRKNRGTGYEVVFVLVDDYTRLAYAEVYPRRIRRAQHGS